MKKKKYKRPLRVSVKRWPAEWGHGYPSSRWVVQIDSGNGALMLESRLIKNKSRAVELARRLWNGGMLTDEKTLRMITGTTEKRRSR